MKRIEIVFAAAIVLALAIAFSIPSTISAKQYADLKFTGIYSQRGNIPLYVKASENLAASACDKMQDTVKRGAATSIGAICEVTCKRALNPDWFLTFVAVKKNKIPNPREKSDYITTPMDGEWDKVFFCGWNPERGVSDKDIGQEGIAGPADVAVANAMCKKGTDRNIIYVIGAQSSDQCRSDCLKCPIPAGWKN